MSPEEKLIVQRAASKKHYEANKEQYLARNRRVVEEIKAYLNELKSKPCTDCGQSYPPYVMDFDHLGDNKVGDIARLKRLNNKKKLEEELAKCELVCSNCHRERTWKRLQNLPL